MTLVYLTEARAVVLGGGLGHEADARGITDLGDTEPGGGVATSLLVGSGPDGEGKENPEADHLEPRVQKMCQNLMEVQYRLQVMDDCCNQQQHPEIHRLYCCCYSTVDLSGIVWLDVT